MDESRIEELLAASAERTAVGPAPVDAMVAGARRTRRNRRAAWGGGVLAAALVLGSAALFGTGTGADRPPAADDPTHSPAPTPEPAPDVPEGHRLVATGDVGAVVPEAWGMNRTRCGTPMKDTVVLDGGGICLALVPRPEGVESLELVEARRPFQLEAGYEVGEIAGERAEVGEVECVSLSMQELTVCERVVYLPERHVGFVASSSTQPASAARAEVEAMLEGIRVLDTQVGVPDHLRIASGMPQGRSGERYVARLEQLGLTADVTPRRMPGFTPGYLLEVSPAPGTVLDPGDTVQVVVVAEPEGPQDEVRVGMNSDSELWDPDFDDPQVRAHETVHIRVGDGIWAYADGKRSRTLAGALDGDSLEVSDWVEGPNHPHSWVAVRPGRTTVTLTITADGEVVELGRVTVVVRE
jgi:hypothetical protein